MSGREDATTGGRLECGFMARYSVHDNLPMCMTTYRCDALWKWTLSSRKTFCSSYSGQKTALAVI